MAEYVGELITSTEAERRGERTTTYLFDLDFFADDTPNVFTIDATYMGGVSRYAKAGWGADVGAGAPPPPHHHPPLTSRFFNHSCEPNLLVMPVFVESRDERRHHLAFFARRPIRYEWLPRWRAAVAPLAHDAVERTKQRAWGRGPSQVR